MPDHDVSTAFERGWQVLQNGDLLTAAESSGFELLITTDQNLRYQQNLVGRRMAILVLTTTSWKSIRANVAQVVDAVAQIKPGDYVELSILAA